MLMHCTTICNRGPVKVLVKTSQVKGQAVLVKIGKGSMDQRPTCCINTDILNCSYGLWRQ